jgi:hypothetical protein
VRVTDHTPKGWQHIIGGRGSPQWMNDLINIFFSWIIDAISILVGFTGIPNDMLAGFLNNAFFAFQLWESFSRRATVGPYHPGDRSFPRHSVGALQPGNTVRVHQRVLG